MNKIETRVTRDVDSDRVLEELRRYSTAEVTGQSYDKVLVPKLLLLDAEALLCALLDAR